MQLSFSMIFNMHFSFLVHIQLKSSSSTDGGGGFNQLLFDLVMRDVCFLCFFITMV
jgi:hypothetical protein